MLKTIGVLTAVLAMLLTAQSAAADDGTLGRSWTAYVKFQKAFDKQADHRVPELKTKKGDSLDGLKPALKTISAVVAEARRLLRNARPALVNDHASSRTGVRARSFSITTLDTRDRAYRQLQLSVSGLNRAIRLQHAHKKKASERLAVTSIVLILLASDTEDKATKFEKKATKLFAQAARERLTATPAPAG